MNAIFEISPLYMIWLTQFGDIDGKMFLDKCSM